MILGNLTLFVVPFSLEPRPGETYSIRITNPQVMPTAVRSAEVSVDFPRPWYRAEKNRKRQWRWSEADADIVITNPYPYALKVQIRGEWTAHTERTARLTQEGELLWEQPVDTRVREWRLAGIVLQPGENRLRVESDAHNAVAESGDERRLAVCLLRFAIKGEVIVPDSGAD